MMNRNVEQNIGLRPLFSFRRKDATKNVISITKNMDIRRVTRQTLAQGNLLKKLDTFSVNPDLKIDEDPYAKSKTIKLIERQPNEQNNKY